MTYPDCKCDFCKTTYKKQILLGLAAAHKTNLDCFKGGIEGCADLEFSKLNDYVFQYELLLDDMMRELSETERRLTELRNKFE